MDDNNEIVQMPAKNSSYFKLIQKFLEDLFVGEKRRLNKSISDLIMANNELKGVQAAGFIYMGEYYTAEGFRVMGGGTKKETLHDSLTSKIDWHIKSAGRVADEERMIGQIIFKLLMPCETLQDMRDTLPDFLAEMIPALKNLPRHNQPGCSLSNDTRATRQFNKLLERMEFYAAARLMY